MNKETKTQDKPLSFYLNRHYPTTFYPEDDGGFTVIIEDLPGCMTQGDTAEEAFAMIAEAKEIWIETAYEYNDPIPPPSTEIEYSGKTVLRMPKYLHSKLAESAKREGVSLNQYLVSLLSERNALKTFESVQSQLSEIRKQLSSQAQDKKATPVSAASMAYRVSEDQADLKLRTKSGQNSELND
jgi:antitoxin HicB